ncbi:hypothetical protein EC2862600_3328 [Escherichia coli 2862600]|nr:hypothetical protein EC2862600_3328 [Escherichia coli 2862600]
MKIGSGGFSLFSQVESLSGLKGIAQGKEPGPVACRNIHRKEASQRISGEIASLEKKWRFC